jgi:hypothetical protein
MTAFLLNEERSDSLIFIKSGIISLSAAEFSNSE